MRQIPQSSRGISAVIFGGVLAPAGHDMSPTTAPTSALPAVPALLSGAGADTRRRATRSAASLRRPPAVPRRHPVIAVSAVLRQEDEGEFSNYKIRLPSLGVKSLLIAQMGAVLAFVGEPVFAVTGENNYPIDLTSTLIEGAIVAFGYFIVMPPIILNWLRVRWYERKFFEMYVQFMFVFIFFPGLLLWAPLLNFRKFPRDPSMKYPWSTPQDLK